MNKNTGQFLAQQLYPDLKVWLTSLGRKLRNPIRKAKAEVFDSPSELLNSLRAGLVKNNDLVTLECKPSSFGPFLRSHFLSPLVGSRTDMRLGPPLVGANPLIAMMAQTTSHLKPVGLYPPINPDVAQCCLYPSDTTACGFVGLFPGIDQLVEYLPSLLASRHTPYCGMACHITGVVRFADPKLLLDSGVSLEDYEEMRQAGQVWFLDATGDESECNPLDDATTTELWGGLYASGHLEIVSGSVGVNRVVEAMRDAMVAAGFEPQVTQNKAGRKEVMIYGHGIRGIVETQAPLYSLHMDADIGTEYGAARSRFDKLSTQTLSNIKAVCDDASVELKNAMDLDFTYTNSSDAFSVLKSQGASAIADPLAIAIRNWHRKRGL